jgi:hypothetical protein
MQVKNVALYISEMQRSLSDKFAKNFFNDPSQARVGVVPPAPFAQLCKDWRIARNAACALRALLKRKLRRSARPQPSVSTAAVLRERCTPEPQHSALAGVDRLRCDRAARDR